MSAWYHNNDLPLLWPIHAKHRALLFRLLDLVEIQSATQGRNLLDALAAVSKHRHARRDEVEGGFDLGFIPALAGLRHQAPPVRARHVRPART